MTPVEPRDDPDLPGLRPALAGGGRLLAYRHRRRATVADANGFTKIVQPSRVEGLAARHLCLESISGLETPLVRDVTGDGRVNLSAVEGTALHHRIRQGTPLELARVAEGLVELHRRPAQRKDNEATSVNETSRSLRIASRVRPDLVEHLASVADHLSPIDLGGTVQSNVIHGDLHDKNVFVTPRGVALIDLDGIGPGAREVDVANLAVHLELRGLQSAKPSLGRRWAAELLSQYDRRFPLDQCLVRAAARHTWFRLACLYLCRGNGQRVWPLLLERADAA